MSTSPPCSSAAPAPAPAPAPAALEAEPIASTSSAPSPAAPLHVHVKPIIPEGMSKNAHKRLLKQQAFDAAKPARRLKERQQKKEKAAEKRKLVELGLAEKPVSKKVMGGKRQGFGARVVIDCAFDDKMTDKEVKSMTAQLAFCYSSNRAASRPFDMLITGLSGRMKEKLEGTKGRPHESWKGVEWWEEGYEELWAAEATPSSSSSSAAESSAPATAVEETTPSLPAPATAPPISIGISAGQPRSRTPKSSIIYLTGDSPNILHTLSPGTTYILGGIVDRNRYKKLCLEKAEQAGVRHAQLPIGEFMGEMKTRKVLTVNQVYDILLHYTSHQSWSEALQAVMPSRKLETNGRKHKKGGVDGEEDEEEEEEEVEGAGAEETGEEGKTAGEEDDDGGEGEGEGEGKTAPPV